MSELRYDGRSYRLRLSNHATTQMRLKGFQLGRVLSAFSSPTEVYASGSHPGQHRITGKGICLVGEFLPEGVFHLVTVYLDRVVTAPRADQLTTPEGADFARRYFAAFA